MYSQLQYYHQPQASASTGAQWNRPGSYAKSPSHGVGSGGFSATYAAKTAANNPSVSGSVIPPNPVATFTQYYHGWQAHLKEQEAYVNSLPFGSAVRNEAQRHVDWSRYYSDQSSRAAHYFYQNPNAVVAPFDLPPAPTTTNSAQQGAAATAANSASVSPTNSTGKASSSTGSAPRHASKQEDARPSQDDPNGLKRYVQNCLSQCSSQEQRDEMQSEIEKVIAMALQDGTLHTKNWDAEPLLRLASFERKPIAFGFNRMEPQRKSQPARSQQENRKPTVHDNYYGPSPEQPPLAGSVEGNFQMKKAERHRTGPNGYTGYYGPPAESNSPIRQNGQRNNGYYGPESGNSANLGDCGYYGRGASNQSDDPYDVKNHQNTLSTSNLSFEQDVPLFSSQKKKRGSKESGKNSSKKTRVSKVAAESGFEKSSSALAKRASRFNGPGGIEDASSLKSSLDGSDRYMGKRLIGGSQRTLDEEDFEKMTVKGTCKKLEKEYLRLTAPPRADLVRPQPVLEYHLANLKAEREPTNRRHDYLWFCSQLKAVRQDCTVQRIQDGFAVDVYETHARIALEEGDLNEYNQCQTQLKELYEMPLSSDAFQNVDEFVAYRMLYYVFLSTNETYDGGSSDLFKIMSSLTPDQINHPAIAHSCKVREAVASGDYLSFFRLHESCPNLGRHLTSRIVPTMRFRALQRIAKAYRPSVELSFCLRQLGFLESPAQQEAGKLWLQSCGCVIQGDEFLSKDSVVYEPKEDHQNSLI